MSSRIVLSLDQLKELGFEPLCLDPQDQPDDNSENIIKLRSVLPLMVENELTDLQRAVIIRRSNGEKTKDIAIALGVTAPTVTKHYQKGIRRLQQISQYVSPFLR